MTTQAVGMLAGITMTNPSAAGPLFGVHGRSEPKIGDNIVAALPQFSLKCAYAAICAFLPKKAPHCVDSIWRALCLREGASDARPDRRDTSFGYCVRP